MLTEQQETLLFYALEAVQRTLREDENGEIYTRQDEFYFQVHELKNIGGLEELQALIDVTLDALC